MSADAAKPRLGTFRIDRELSDLLRASSDLGRTRRFFRNEPLYEQEDVGTTFHLILTGLVQVSIVRPDGTELILEIMGPDGVCGEGAAFDGMPRFSMAVALEPTETIEFDARRAHDLFAARPELAAALIKVASYKQRILAVRMEHLTAPEPEQRLLELFERLARHFVAARPEGRLLRTYLTHEQIAAMTGLSRVTVTRAMARLKDSGRIDVEDGLILLPKDV